MGHCKHSDTQVPVLPEEVIQRAEAVPTDSGHISAPSALNEARSVSQQRRGGQVYPARSIRVQIALCRCCMAETPMVLLAAYYLLDPLCSPRDQSRTVP